MRDPVIRPVRGRVLARRRPLAGGVLMAKYIDRGPSRRRRREDIAIARYRAGPDFLIDGGLNSTRTKRSRCKRPARLSALFY